MRYQLRRLGRDGALRSAAMLRERLQRSDPDIERARGVLARLALPARWRCLGPSDPMHPPEGDLEAWSSFGYHDALRGWPPRVGAQTLAPWSLAYAEAYSLAAALLLGLITMSKHPNLATALVAAAKAMPTLARDGKNVHGGYTYATADAVAETIRSALAEQGLVATLIGSKVLPPCMPMPEGSIGRQWYVGDVEIRWLLLHESGERLEGCASGAVVVAGQRPHDKAIGAAITYAWGQALRGMVCADREGEHSVDGRHDDGGEAPRARGRKAERKGGTERKGGGLDGLRRAVDERVHDLAQLRGVEPLGAWLAIVDEASLPADRFRSVGPSTLTFAELPQLNDAAKRLIEQERLIDAAVSGSAEVEGEPA